ncbi:hypothetical protein L249_2790, partial [Ophiocordyceps polyrhachis-furcata BCC 54312]
WLRRRYRQECKGVPGEGDTARESRGTEKPAKSARDGYYSVRDTAPRCCLKKSSSADGGLVYMGKHLQAAAAVRRQHPKPPRKIDCGRCMNWVTVRTTTYTCGAPDRVTRPPKQHMHQPPAHETKGEEPNEKCLQKKSLPTPSFLPPPSRLSPCSMSGRAPDVTRAQPPFPRLAKGPATRHRAAGRGTTPGCHAASAHRPADPRDATGRDAFPGASMTLDGRADCRSASMTMNRTKVVNVTRRIIFEMTGQKSDFARDLRLASLHEWDFAKNRTGELHLPGTP